MKPAKEVIAEVTKEETEDHMIVVTVEVTKEETEDQMNAIEAEAIEVMTVMTNEIITIGGIRMIDALMKEVPSFFTTRGRFYYSSFCR